MSTMALPTADQQRRRRRWRIGLAVLGGSLVLAAVLAIALGGAGGRKWGERAGRTQAGPSSSPLVGTADAAAPSIETLSATAAQAVAEPVPTRPSTNASAAAPVPTSKPVGAKATALGESTQDALGKLTAAAVAAAAGGSAAASDKQPQVREGPEQCLVETAEELTDAVENGPCTFILLTKWDRQAYVLEREVNVTRCVTVMGHPAYLPQIDAGGGGAVRAFHVLGGGYLDLRFVRVRQGAGEVRDRYGAEGADLPSQVVEIRGGAVAMERGALGASFVGVTFISADNTAQSVQNAIALTQAGTGGRVYGGHVFVMDGDVEFVACNFWDTTLLLPLTDQITIGGDILVVGGNCRITASTFTVTSGFSSYALAGGCVAVLGGTMVVTWSFEQAQSIFNSANGPGQTFWVGGGVLIMTGFDFRLVSAALLFTGFGDFSVGGGVLIMTAVDITNSYGILLAAGAAFYIGVGSGVLVQNAVSYVQFCGPMYNIFAGGSVFVGSGASINTGCPSIFTTSVSAFSGIGSFSYNAAGVSVWVGCPYAYYSATFSFYGNGGTTAQSAGWLTWVGSPAFQPVAIQYFAGAGNVLWEGAGAAIVSGSPVFAPTALAYSNGNAANFVVGQQSFKKGPGTTYAGGKTIASTNPNVSRALLSARVGPRARAGKRYLKGQPRVPFPWVAFGEQEVQAGKASILMSGTRSFDGVDLDDPAQREALASWVPPDMLKATEAIADLRADIKAKVGAAPSSPSERHGRGRGRRHQRQRRQQEQEQEQEQQDGPVKFFRRDTLYVGEDVAYCGACDVDSLSGPGAATCETDCAAVEAKSPLPSLSFDYGQVQFEPVHLVLTSIETSVPAASVADDGGAATLAMDVRDALRRWLRSPVVDLPDAQVAVFSADAADGDELVRRWVGEDAAAAAAQRETMGPSPCRRRRLRLTAAFVAHDAEAAALLRAAAQEVEEQELEVEENTAAAVAAREALLEAVSKAVPTTGEEGDCAEEVEEDAAIVVSFKRALYIPATDSPELLQEQQQATLFTSKGGPSSPVNSIRLVDPLRPGVPVGAAGMGSQQNVVLGRSYRVDLAGFPPRASVLVALVPAPSAGDGAVEAALEPRTLLTLKTDDRGNARALCSVLRSLPPGDYYLQAAPEEGEGSSSIWGLSQLYKVSARPARRRRLGSVLEL